MGAGDGRCGAAVHCSRLDSGVEGRFQGAIALYGALMILSTCRVSDFTTE